MVFEPFDPSGDLRVTSGNLPHWFQVGVTYFVTYRTEDSMPARVAQLWYCRREDWLRRHGINPRMPNWKVWLRRLPRPQQQEFNRTFSREFMEHLDRGHGECVLKRRELATVVADNLQYFDGQRYVLANLVVMPNHVHVLMCLLAETDIQKQCRTWKKYQATMINRSLGRRGRFWHEESFDHLVRTPEEYEYLRRYIADNPPMANLKDDEYLYWERTAT